MTKHTNINEDNLKAIMDAMPDEMSEEELCALTLTMHMAYMKKSSEIAKNLIVTIATHAMSQGLTNPEIAKVFNMAVASYLDPRPNQTEH